MMSSVANSFITSSSLFESKKGDEWFQDKMQQGALDTSVMCWILPGATGSECKEMEKIK